MMGECADTRVLSALVVEDDAIAARMIFRQLRYWRCTAVVAPDGASAIRELSERFFQLVLVDIGLPDVDGLDVMIEARRMQPDSEQAALTGAWSRDLVHRVQMLGATYLSKPAPRNLFAMVVDRARAKRITPRSSDALVLHVGRMARRWRLTETQHRILLWSVMLGTVHEYCARFGGTPGTFVNHLKAIRARARASATSTLLHRLLLDVIEGRIAEDDI